MSSSSLSSIIDQTQSKIQSYMVQLRKNFECTICIDFFEDPVITNCQHVFCKKCIESYIGSKRSQGCPLCKTAVNLRSLRSFTVMNHYVENTKKLTVAFEKDHQAAKEVQQGSKPDNRNSPFTDTSRVHTRSELANITNQNYLSPLSNNVQKRKRINSNEPASNKKKKQHEVTSMSPLTTSPSASANLIDVTRINDTVQIDECAQSNTLVVGEKSNMLSQKNVTKAAKSIDFTKKGDVNPTDKMTKAASTSHPIEKEKRIINEEKSTNRDHYSNDNTAKQIDKTTMLLHVTDQSESDSSRSQILSVYDLNQASKSTEQPVPGVATAVAAAAVVPVTTTTTESVDPIDSVDPNEPKNDDPLKFRKEKSDISDQHSSYLARSKEETTTITNFQQQQQQHTPQAVENSNALKNLTKSCGDAMMFNEARVQISQTAIIPDTHDFQSEHLDIPTEPNVHNTEVNRLIEAQAQRVDDTILFENVAEIQTIPDCDLHKSKLIKPALPTVSKPDIVAKETNRKLVDSSTNTTRVETREIGVQVNMNEIEITPIVPNVELVVEAVFIGVYQLIESESIRTYLEDFFRTLPVIVPESPPSQRSAPRINGSQTDYKLEETILDTSIMNGTSRPKKSASLKKDFLNSTSMFSSAISPGNHRHKPSLEFVVSQSSSSSKLNTEVVSNSRSATSLDVIDATPIKNRSTLIHLNSLGRNDEQLRELEERLSKSANRIEISNTSRMLLETSIGRLIETSMGENGPMLNHTNEIKKEDGIKNPEPNAETKTQEVDRGSYSDQPTIVINVADESTMILTATSQKQPNSNDNSIEFKQPSMPPPPRRLPPPTPAPHPLKPIVPNSFNINSLDTTIDQPLQITTNESMLMTSNHGPQDGGRVLPPYAVDILGTSLVSQNDSTPPIVNNELNTSRNTLVSSSETNKSILETSTVVTKREKMDIPESAIARKSSVSTVNDLGSKNSKETQLLTDSAMMAIDDFCETRALDANTTTVNRTVSNPKKSTSSPYLANSLSIPSRIEFVSSLLKPEMKNILSNYAAQIKATIANDVTDTTTHLIVDSDKDLLCGVTGKYLKAITRKIWIVSILWILNNINSSKFLNPELFEIKGDNVFKMHNGPRSSRLSEKGLFENHELIFVGQFSDHTISLSTIMELVTLSGASIKNAPTDFSNDKSISKYVIFDENKMLLPSAKAARIRENSGIVCVNKAWLLDSLACFKLLDTKQYETYA